MLWKVYNGKTRILTHTCFSCLSAVGLLYTTEMTSNQDEKKTFTFTLASIAHVNPNGKDLKNNKGSAHHGTSLRHPHCGHSNNRHLCHDYSLEEKTLTQCSQHCPERCHHFQHQSGHCQMPRHLKGLFNELFNCHSINTHTHNNIIVKASHQY